MLQRECFVRVLIAVFGSYGDILPFISIGCELQSRGHEVRMYGSANFEQTARAKGLTFSSLGDPNEYQTVVSDANVGRPVYGWRHLAPYLDRFVRLSFRAMRADVIPGQTLAIGSTLAFSVNLLRELDAIPTVAVHLSPAALRSEFDAPKLLEHFPGPSLPRITKRAAFAILDHLFLDPMIGTHLNRYRAELGLPAIRRVFNKAIHDADLTVGMFPEWFAPAQPDWPPGIKLTGFPLADQARTECENIDAFLAAGPAPIGFSAGTQTAAAQRFFTTSMEVCQRLGRRGILLTPHADQIPAGLPPGLAHFTFAPFEQLLPRLSAFVHHGGIGSVSHALRAGTPQLIRPTAFDQFENARRTVQLGVAKQVMVRDYTTHHVAGLLDQLIKDEEVKARCLAWAKKFDGNPVLETCALIIKLFDQRLSG